MGTQVRSLTILDSIVAELKGKKFSKLSSIQVFIMGVLYGIYSFYTSYLQSSGDLNNIYLFFYIISGYIYMIVAQIGITLVLGSTLRIFKGSSSNIHLFIAVGYSMLPYGILSILIHYYNNFKIALNPSGNIASMVSITFMLIILFYFLAKIIQLLENFSLLKSFASVSISYIFVGSLIYLFLF